jgi:hypothetical protein
VIFGAGCDLGFRLGFELGFPSFSFLRFTDQH